MSPKIRETVLIYLSIFIADENKLKAAQEISENFEVGNQEFPFI